MCIRKPITATMKLGFRPISVVESSCGTFESRVCKLFSKKNHELYMMVGHDKSSLYSMNVLILIEGAG